ncbi:hypothetical protein [Serinibacter salmoneus]|uniref:Uncharacterized protein n=1 Tax=Serinibacter salmoneus TaxID=556530 RepID=A0A2A9CY32_9MICO|nr:hypothetical protein [Serinibacter salmoneus]PFG18582.1 hypothetical protein ATL40_0122 [Serinibacter salmoneus]
MTLPIMPTGSAGAAPSLGVLLCEAEPSAVVETLGSFGFTGWVSPRVGRWCVAVPEHPLGHVAAKRRDLLATGAATGAALGAPAIAVAIRREELMYLTAHDGEAALVDYVSDAQLARPGDEFAYGPEGAHGGEALARLSGLPEAGGEAAAILSEEYGESESESERLVRLARLLDWPTWLVAVNGLAKRRMSIGPEPKEFVRLRAGRTGIGGMALNRVIKVARRSDLTADD